MSAATREPLVDQWPPFLGLPQQSRLALEALAEAREAEAGTMLFTTGQEDGSRLFALAEGEARLTSSDPSSGEVTVTLLLPGTIVGLRGFALGEDFLSGAALQAVTACSFLIFEAARLHELCLEDGTVAWTFFEIAASRLGAEAAAPPRKRVYRTLLRMVRRQGARVFVPRLPRHAALAAAAGVSDVEAAGAIAALLSEGIAKRTYPDLDILDDGALERAAYG